MELIELVIMAAMVLFNGVFAGYEIALAAVTVARLQSPGPREPRGAKAALYMKQNMEASLAAMQVAITLLGASAAAIGGAGAAESIQPFLQERSDCRRPLREVLATLPVVIPLTFLTILFGRIDAEGLFAPQQGVGLPAAVAA